MSQSETGEDDQRKAVEAQPSDLRDLEYLGNAIYSLLVEAQANDKREAKWGLRYPFFHNVSIRTGAGTCYSAFSRDISEQGIGLLHNFELPLGEVGIAISSKQGYSVPLRARIAWCRSCGEGWYISGCKIVSAGA